MVVYPALEAQMAREHLRLLRTDSLSAAYIMAVSHEYQAAQRRHPEGSVPELFFRALAAVRPRPSRRWTAPAK